MYKCVGATSTSHNKNHIDFFLVSINKLIFKNQLHRTKIFKSDLKYCVNHFKKLYQIHLI